MAGVPNVGRTRPAGLVFDEYADRLRNLRGSAGPALDRINEQLRYYLGPHAYAGLENLGTLGSIVMDAPASIVDSASQMRGAQGQFAQGNWGQGALDTLSSGISALGVLPMVAHVPEGMTKGGDALAETLAEPQGITAYHGSPHSFDRFSMEHIGSGEGAQAYGHGLYFAENEGVARSYRDNLSPDPEMDINNILAELETRGTAFPEDIESIGVGDVLEMMKPYSSLGGDEGREALAREILTVFRGTDPDGPVSPEGLAAYQRILKLLPPESAGSMYQVRLNVSPDELLDWDKPLSEQPQRVREALEQWGFREANPTGQQIYDSRRIPFAGGDPVKITQALRDAGIRGIRYADAMSRGAEGGTSNYVMFSDDVIDILKRYGIAGLIGGGAAAAALRPGESEAQE